MMKRSRNTFDRIDCNEGIHLTMVDHSDASSLVKYLNDRDIYNNTGSIPFPYTNNDAVQFITQVKKFEEENNIQRDWAIRNATGEQIGGVGFLFNYGINAHRSEIGYWLAKPFWNQGIGTNVVKVWSDLMLERLHFVRLEALVYQDNKPSCRVLEKAGFSREGLLRKACRKGDEYRDAYLYAKLSGSDCI